ncbi:MAG: UbiH/UbiF/VisC/COQ6 family ubiquinone biosynthesis hydroxylase [Nevskiales bacterium]
MRHDVVIVGGGLVGASLAIALHRAEVDVALVEAARPAAFDPAADYDLRFSAIAPSSQRWLAKLDAWPQLAVQRACAYQHMQVWEAAGPDVLEFDATELGLPELGHIVENNLLLDALWRQLDGVAIYCPARLAAMELNAQAAQLSLEDGRALECALVIGADGSQSLVRELAGIASFGWSYGQRGIVANVTTEHAHAATAWQRFLPTGPLAFLPLADGRCSIVWSADETLADDLLALSDTTFCERLGAAFEHKLGMITATSRRAAFPLTMQQAERYSLPRLALLGDAAHVIHPLAGQGVNLGFQDAELLGSELSSAREQDKDLGAERHLRRYERTRKSENALMVAATDGLYRLFHSDNSLLRFARTRGMGLVNRLAPLKQQFMQRAVGL